MVLAQSDFRRTSLASYHVARAFALSLLFHALLIGIVELGHQTGFWKVSLLFSKRQRDLEAEAARLVNQARQQPQEEEMPLVFVEVDPSQAAPEPPKDAKYYSGLNSRAANPDTTLDTPQPKVEGTQDRVPQTLERARPEPEPLQPLPAPSPPIAETKPAPPPEPARPEPVAPAEETPAPGDLALAKAPEKPPSKPALQKPGAVERSQPPPPRPRTLAAARRQKGLPGEKMKQEGGTKRFSLASSLDVRATPFGTYDGKIIAAIQKRWYDLLDSRDFAANYSGKVVLEFRLNSDGRVTDMRVGENNVTEILALLCQRAVQDPAPFDPWPPDLRRMVGKEYREVRFTFYYN